MNDSLGGTVVLVIIMFFIAFASMYLAFNVNYMKAFRMKNKIISLYEEYQGDCVANSRNECFRSIVNYADEIGYEPSDSFKCDSGYTMVSNGRKNLYCVKEHSITTNSKTGKSKNDLAGVRYYSIYTRININIPIFSNLMGKKLLSVSGDTATIEK